MQKKLYLKCTKYIFYVNNYNNYNTYDLYSLQKKYSNTINDII